VTNIIRVINIGAQCDLRRPGCQRCAKIGQKCSGYRDLERPQLRFRILTPSSYTHKARRLCQQPGWLHENEPAECSAKLPGAQSIPICYDEYQFDNLIQSIASQRKSSPSFGLAETLEGHAMPLIMSQFSSFVHGSYRIHSGFESFPDLFQKAEAGSAVYFACHAVSAAYFSNRMRTSNPAFAHRRLYGKSLRAVHLALLDSSYQGEDSTLLAVWLLCLYAVGPPCPLWHSVP
jgi:hypothetical protein